MMDARTRTAHTPAIGYWLLAIGYWLLAVPLLPQSYAPLEIGMKVCIRYG